MRIIWAFLPVKRFMADTENICYVDARTGALSLKAKILKQIFSEMFGGFYETIYAILNLF